MATINATITGASRDARMSWAGKSITLTSMGAGNFTASFTEPPGTYTYSIVLFGDPADAWSAKVTDQTTTHNFAGHMSPSGTDTTGDTPFTVSN